jgi:hypothetical protein
MPEPPRLIRRARCGLPDDQASTALLAWLTKKCIRLK